MPAAQLVGDLASREVEHGVAVDGPVALVVVAVASGNAWEHWEDRLGAVELIGPGIDRTRDDRTWVFSSPQTITFALVLGEDRAVSLDGRVLACAPPRSHLRQRTVQPKLAISDDRSWMVTQIT
jgi:hypothetical protein